MRQNISLQLAYIVHTREYRETSLLVDVLFQEFGRVTLVARGVRRARSATKALLQPFTPLLITAVGKSDLMTLSQVEPASSAFALQGEQIVSGLYLNELLQRLVHPHDAMPGLFTSYQLCLQRLHGGEGEPALRRFEMALLKELGYEFELHNEAHSQTPIREDADYHFTLENGFVRITEHQKNKQTFTGAELLALADNAWDNPVVVLTAKRLMRIALRTLLGNRPLASRLCLYREEVQVA